MQGAGFSAVYSQYRAAYSLMFRRTPIPVNLKRKDLKTELGKAISSTYYHPSTGTSQ